MRKMSAEEVRRQWSYSKDPGPEYRTTEEWWQIRDEACAEFDRWLDQVKADAWDEGYSAAKLNARMWGHTDNWEGDDTNPYRGQEEA